MTDHALDAGRVWGARLLAFYCRDVALEDEDRASLSEQMSRAVAEATRSGRAPGRWSASINAALDAWEAARDRSDGPRVAHVDAARGVITKRD